MTRSRRRRTSPGDDPEAGQGTNGSADPPERLEVCRRALAAVGDGVVEVDLGGLPR